MSVSDALATTILDDHPLLEGLPPEVVSVVKASFEERTYGFGQTIIREGDGADAFYVVVSGRVRVVTSGEGGSEVVLATRSEGEVIGEIGALTGGTRTATVRASAPTVMLRLDAATLRGLARSYPALETHLRRHVRRRTAASLLKVDGPFGDLDDEALTELLDALEPVEVPAGGVVATEGEASGPLFVVREGRLEVRRGGAPIGVLTRGDVFGERSLITGTPRSATVVAESDSELFSLAADTLHDLSSRYPRLQAALDAVRLRHERADRTSAEVTFTEEELPADAERAAPAVDDTPDVSVLRTLQQRVHRERGWLPRNFPHVAQIDASDCGAASLAMISRYYGKRMSLSRARHAARVGIDGASLAGLVHGGEEIGLQVRPIKASKRNLEDLPLPAVVHWDANHWIVLYDVRADHVKVSDPALSRLRIPRDEFERRWTGYTALFEPTERFEELKEDKPDLTWALPFVKREIKPIAMAMGLALLISLLELGIPLAARRIIDDVLGQGRIDLLAGTVLALVAAVLLIGVSGYLQGYMLARAAVRIDGATLDFVADRLLSLPMGYFYARRTGDIQRRLAGSRAIRSFMLQMAQLGATSTVQLVVAVGLMFFISIPLTLVFLGAIPLYAILMRVAVWKVRPLLDRLEDAFGRYQSRQIDAIKGIETVKSLGSEQRLRREMIREFDALVDRQFSADIANMTYRSAVQLVSFAVLAMFLWVGGLQVVESAEAARLAGPGARPDFTIGDFVAFNALLGLATRPVFQLLALFDSSQFVAVLLERLHDVLSHEPEQGHDRTHLQPVPKLAGRVTFDRVTFRYGGPDAPTILDEVSFDVTPGTTVAIVGRSGSGKTTLVKLLAGLIEPSQGSIRYDNVDMTDLDHSQLRQHIGFVLQENHLFSDTIAANIAFGHEHTDRARIEWAARVANAHEFIARLPLGYETRIGETGLLLSGGQRQRIAIARAVYQQPAILILDEATSALDTESERAVQGNLDRLLEGRTSFVIAHRLSTIRNADTIVVLEKGRVAERGTHEQLLERRGLYHHLVSQQLGV